ncbi:MAG: DUF2946 domain-containing protein [Rhodanobacteraceae bacterium]|nr:DUF2946 domain-containing protein [Rhodanobacteraceae bacterium]
MRRHRGLRAIVSHHRFQRPAVAWLGLLAIWLSVLAPVVSQTLTGWRADAQRTVAIHADTHSAHGAHHAHDAHGAHAANHVQHDAHQHAAADPHAGHHDAHAGDPLHACGYCDLFAHSPVTGDVPHLASLLPTPPLAPVPLPAAPATRPVSILTAAPRGPPDMAAIA